VIVESASSADIVLRNMVYQGTVWGPTFWNGHFEDARHAVNGSGFEEVIYADDLNCFRMFPRSVGSHVIMEALSNCQEALHRWGEANQVTFDAAKEHCSIISTTHPVGNSFTVVGVEFDLKLQMGAVVGPCTGSALSSRRSRSAIRRTTAAST